MQGQDNLPDGIEIEVDRVIYAGHTTRQCDLGKVKSLCGPGFIVAPLGFGIGGLDGFVGSEHCPECQVEGQVSGLYANGQASQDDDKTTSDHGNPFSTRFPEQFP